MDEDQVRDSVRELNARESLGLYRPRLRVPANVIARALSTVSERSWR